LDDVDISGVSAPQSLQTQKTEFVAQQPPLQPRSPGLPPEELAGLSARERNKLKRKAKNDAKNKGKEKYVKQHSLHVNCASYVTDCVYLGCV
jgi:TATA-binding protein-associated factor